MGLKFVILALFGLAATAVELRHQEEPAHTQADDQAKYAWYNAEEKEGGACETSLDCDGARTCSASKVCEGIARGEKNGDYTYDEEITGYSCIPGEKNTDYYCNGNRTCS